MLFRLTQQLSRKIKAGPLATSPLDANPLADWSARVFRVDRTQYIMLSHTASMYSVVMLGRGITRDKSFLSSTMDAIHDFMAADGLGLVYMNFIASAATTVRFCKPLDRSVTGSMNELEFIAKDRLETGAWSPFDVGFKLNETWLSAIATEGDRGYARPRDAFKRLEM